MRFLSKQERYYRKGKALFRKLERPLKTQHRGKVVAIDPGSGAFVLGKDALEAALKAKEQFPGHPVDFFRVGFPAVHKFRVLAA